MRTIKRSLFVLGAIAALVVPYVLATATAGTIWHPTAGASISWAWQLSGSPNLANHVQMFDIDGFDNTAATVSALHAQGTTVVCYIDLGTWENWRADQASFPSSVLGSSNGWPGEKWLDIRQISTLAPIMTARMQMCVQKGFDALEPDNIDGYSNSTGFAISAADQLAYNEWIATTAHSLGLSVGLKNDVDQTAQLQPYFDWALNEQCNQYSECDTLSPFTAANKAVFNAEYGSSNSFCAADIAAHINGARFDLDLTGATDVPCGGWGTTAVTSTTTNGGGATSTTIGSGVTSTTLGAVSTTSQPPASNPRSTTSTTARSTTSTTRRATTTTTNRVTSGRGSNGTRRTTTTTTPRRLRRNATVTPNVTPTVTSSTGPFWKVGWWGHLVSGDGSSVGSGASVAASATTLDAASTLQERHHHYWG